MLDLPTLAVVLITLGVAIGLPLALTTSSRRGTGALWYWALALLAMAAGSLLLALRDVIPLLVSVMLGNALVICAVALQGEIAAALTRTTQFLDATHRWFFAIVTAPLLGVMVLTVDATWPRIAYMAVVQCYLVGQLLWQLRISPVGAREPRHPSVVAFEILLWIYFAGTILRIAATLALTPSESFLLQTIVPLAALLAILIVAIGTCILIWHELAVKDEAIRLATSTDIASGLANRTTFLQALEAYLTSAPASSKEIVALLRVQPEAKKLDLYEEGAAYRSAGAQIERFLRRSDLLARTGDSEFGILFHGGGDIARAVGVLERALAQVLSHPVSGNRDDHQMSAAAVLLSCTPADSSGEIIRTLRGELERTNFGEVRVVPAPPRESDARKAG